MKQWRKIAAAAALVAIGVGSGVAWAGGPNPDGSGTPPSTTKSAKLLGAGASEQKFVAITPCRLVDTREVGGKLGVKETRTYDVRGSGATFAGQGGKAGGCGIPATGVTAVEVTVTAVDATGTGFLRVFPSSEPNATFMNYTDAFNPSNTGTVSLCGADGGICLINSDLRIRNYGSTTDVVVDVQGYYSFPLAAAVNSNGTLGRGSRAASSSRSSTGQYSVKFDRDVSSCVMTGSIGYPTPAGQLTGEIQVQYNAVDHTEVYVATKNSSGTLADLPFMIQVTC